MLESSQLNDPVLYLASNSPRRRQLLTLAGWVFTPWPADIDETPAPGELPGAYVLRLAEAKAREAARKVPRAGVILAADTAVVDPVPVVGKPPILGKPADEAEAVEMLRRLRGKVHQVYTAVAAMRSTDEDVLVDLCVSHVPMRDYSESEMQAYAASGDPLDKAGAYAIQHTGFHPVEGFTGCTASVMGLPLCHTAHLLSRLGVSAGNGWAVSCLTNPDKACPADHLARLVPDQG